MSNSQSEDRITNGRAGAAILSAGVGALVIGVLAVAADAFKPLGKILTFYKPSGPLSGVSTMAVVLWLATWFVLNRLWRTKAVAIGKVNAVAFLLLALGILLTFPPLAELLQGK